MVKFLHLKTPQLIEPLHLRNLLDASIREYRGKPFFPYDYNSRDKMMIEHYEIPEKGTVVLTSGDGFVKNIDEDNLERNSYSALVMLSGFDEKSKKFRNFCRELEDIQYRCDGIT